MAEAKDTMSAGTTVLVIHSTDDVAKAKVIMDGLRDEGMEIVTPDTEANIGKPVYDSIVDAIYRSSTVLILLSKTALRSKWVNFEMLLSFEKSHRDGAMCVRLVFEGVTEAERKAFKTGVLELIPDVLLDFNKDTWKRDLVTKIREPAPMKNLLPAGNVALGLLYNYFIGFLRIVLPSVVPAIENYELPSSSAWMSKRFLIWIPDTCKVPKLETSGESEYTIRKLDKPLPMEAAHGDKRRSYSTNVYGIKRGNSDELFFTGECPFIVETMSKVKEMGFADLDLRLQVERFQITLMDFVNHRANQSCNGTASFIAYNVSETTLAAAIWNTLQEEMTQAQTPTEEVGVLHKIGSKPQAPEYDVYLTYCDSEEDQDMVQQIVTRLQEQDLIFTDSTAPWTGNEPQKWKIFILSRESIKNLRFVHQFKVSMEHSMASDQKQVVPVLASSLNIQDVPLDLRWALVLKQSQPNYTNMLWAAMQGNQTMTVTLPTGNVAEGLTYSYVINYLSITLLGKTAAGRGMKERFLDAMVKYNVTHCKCVPMLFVIVPKTCSFPPPGTQFENEEHLGPLEPVEIGVRKYFLQFYVLTLVSGEKVCYAREYATPAVTLHEMAEKYPFTGLNKDEKHRQAKQFADFVDQVMRDEGCRQKVGDMTDLCSVVYFDDEVSGMTGMTSALSQQLSRHIESGRYLQQSDPS